MTKTQSNPQPGLKFGRWTALTWAPSVSRWLCQCECGRKNLVTRADLTRCRVSCPDCGPSEMPKDKVPEKSGRVRCSNCNEPLCQATIYNGSPSGMCNRCFPTTRKKEGRNREVASLYKSGTKVRAIAQKFNLSKQRVGQIVNAEGCEPRRGLPKYPHRFRRASEISGLPLGAIRSKSKELGLSKDLSPEELALQCKESLYQACQGCGRRIIILRKGHSGYCRRISCISGRSKANPESRMGRLEKFLQGVVIGSEWVDVNTAKQISGLNTFDISVARARGILAFREAIKEYKISKNNLMKRKVYTYSLNQMNAIANMKAQEPK